MAAERKESDLIPAAVFILMPAHPATAAGLPLPQKGILSDFKKRIRMFLAIKNKKWFSNIIAKALSHKHFSFNSHKNP